MPTCDGASCTTTSRPVRRTDSYTGSMSSGESVRRSMTSSVRPSSATAAAASSAVRTIGPYATTVQSSPGRTTREACNGYAAASGGADDAGLGEGGVHTPFLAKVLLQAVGDPEDAAELADVLAHDEDLRVAFHGPPQPDVDRLAEGQGLAHQCPLPSNDEWYE